MFEFIDVLIVGAILYYIVQAVRRAASAQADRRPPGSIAAEEGESLTWTERTQRALEGALEWEEEQERRREEAELRAELGIDDSLIRLSVGVEDVEDLIDELRAALQ